MSDDQFKKLVGEPVLVTGATGFVGGHLTRSLLKVGADVSILVRKSSDAETIDGLRNAGAKVVYGDVTDRESVFAAVKGIKYIFHIAALFRQAKFSDDVYYQVNLEGTRNVFDAAEEFGVKRVVHCSTIGVHSSIDNPPADETIEYSPADIYQVTKAEGEKLALQRAKEGKVEVVVIRPAMIWGDGDKRLLKLFKGVKRRRFPIIGTGKVLTHWVYVLDLVRGFMLAAITEEANGEIYIIAGRRPAKLEEVVGEIAKAAGVKPLPFKVPAEPVQLLGSLVEAVCRPFGIEPPLYRRRVDFFVKTRAFTTAKAERELGYKAQYEFPEEVQRIYNWYEQHGWL